MAERCQTCRFWDVYEEGAAFVDVLKAGEIGDCRRRSPSISDELLRRTLPGPSCDQFEALANNLYLPSAFPVTSATSWCGDFQPITAASGAVMDAIAASKAADALFTALPRDLEHSHPDQFRQAEEGMLDAFRRAVDETSPQNWDEFIAIFDLACAGGRFGLDDDRAERMLTHARRLAGAAA